MAACIAKEKVVLNLTRHSQSQSAQRANPSQIANDLKTFQHRHPPTDADINDVATHQRWMLDYHKAKQGRQPSETSSHPPVTTNGYKVLSPRLLDQKSTKTTLNGTTAELSALNINGQGNNETDMSLQRSKTELLEGYKVYRGPPSFPPRNATHHGGGNSSRSSDPPRFVVANVVGHEHGRRASLQSFYYHDRLVLAKYPGKDGSSQRHNHYQHNMARGHSLPFRNHATPRARPQSAILTSSSHAVAEKDKGSKPKQISRKGRSPIHVPTKTSGVKHPQHSKIVEFNGHQPESFPLSPRHVMTLPRPSYKLDFHLGPKPDTPSRSSLKSILKNNGSPDTNSYLSIRPLRPEHDLTRDMPDKTSPSHVLSSDFSLNDLILSPREANRLCPARSDTSSTSTSHEFSGSSRPVALPKRPMSAVTCPSKYELTDSQSAGRKSVTFNSYVSLMTGNRVSTIRSLSVDV